jgi:hypothetical protein
MVIHNAHISMVAAFDYKFGAMENSGDELIAMIADLP